MPMKKSLLSIALGAAMLAGFAEPGTARRHEQDAAYDATRTGKIRPLREIENRVVPRWSAHPIWVPSSIPIQPLTA
jgi:hypothetical protein